MIKPPILFLRCKQRHLQRSTLANFSFPPARERECRAGVQGSGVVLGCRAQTAVGSPSPLPQAKLKRKIHTVILFSQSLQTPFSARATKFYPRPACRHALRAGPKGKSGGRGRREKLRAWVPVTSTRGEGSKRCDEYCLTGFVLRWAPCKSRLLGALMKTSIQVQSRFYRMRMGAALSEGLQGI